MEYHMSLSGPESIGLGLARNRLRELRDILHPPTKRSCSRCFTKTSSPGTILVPEFLGMSRSHVYAGLAHSNEGRNYLRMRDH